MRGRLLRTAAAVATLAALAVAGCAGPPSRQRTATAPLPAVATPSGGAAGTVTGTVDPGAVATARAFALAARAWTADTLAAGWRRQIALSTGSLQRTLRRTAPLPADLGRLRADGAAVTATVLDVVPVQVDGARARLVVRLNERTTAAGQTTTQTTANEVDLVRHGRGWRVSAFTLAP